MNTGQVILTMAFTIREDDTDMAGTMQAHDFVSKLTAWAQLQPEVRYQQRLHVDYADRQDYGNPLVHVRTVTVDTSRVVGNWNGYQRFDVASTVGVAETPEEGRRYRSLFRVNSDNRCCAPRIDGNETMRNKIKSAYLSAVHGLERQAFEMMTRFMMADFEGADEDGMLDAQLYEGRYGNEDFHIEEVM